MVEMHSYKFAPSVTGELEMHLNGNIIPKLVSFIQVYKNIPSGPNNHIS